MLFEPLAHSIAVTEEYFHTLARIRARRATGPVPPPPKIYVPVFDPARVVAVFLDEGMIHIVWDNEHIPFSSLLDEAYERIRCLKFGRVADVESVEVVGSRAEYPHTFGEPQPYETSLHFTATTHYNGTIFSWTWNHMLSSRPSPWVMIRGGYRLEHGYEIHRGSREDAEDYAKSLGC